MALVLYASVAVRWALRNELDSRAEQTFERVRTEQAVVAALWWFEIRDKLVANERRRRITEQQTASSYRTFRFTPFARTTFRSSQRC